MKKLSLILLLAFFGLALKAQPVMTLAEKEHDYGTFKEEAGPQTYDFQVTNTGNQPLVIQRIVTSCGCTTPDWTKEPIAPGGKGKITAVYDPRNAPGKFSKTLSVYTNSKPEMVTLVIKGEVTPREKTIEELYTFEAGPVRFESNHLAFTNVLKTEKKIRTMQVINTSNEPVTIDFDQVPTFLAMKVTPTTLKPGQKGLVSGTFDATQNDGWGQSTYMIKVVTNGNSNQNAYYYISANLVEDFSSLTKEELENAPLFSVPNRTYDIGKMKGSTTADIEFVITNSGKSDLYIRNVRSTCGCTAVQQGNKDQPIKPGESTSLKAVFSSGGYKGKVTKAIYVYTNDPKNSEVVLMLTADVEQP
jgi:hypothetical protein